ncbi:uncharacterized protein LOC142645158 [Dermatophagoides pteronyssinus]|uniref:uncharacterized protein LOC142645158 n=1 Tax=Dermatophagoides pteronyssinus TaxID=6956 RepID=UPI003F67D8F7
MNIKIFSLIFVLLAITVGISAQFYGGRGGYGRGGYGRGGYGGWGRGGGYGRRGGWGGRGRGGYGGWGRRGGFYG